MGVEDWFFHRSILALRQKSVCYQGNACGDVLVTKPVGVLVETNYNQVLQYLAVSFASTDFLGLRQRTPLDLWDRKRFSS